MIIIAYSLSHLVTYSLYKGVIMKILFCTDGSDISLSAIENLSKFTKHAEVDIICVIDWSFLPASMNIDKTNYSKVYENIADSVLIFTENEVKKHHFTITNKIKSFGSAAEGIIEQAEIEKYDLIVMGSHGKKGLQKWLGSVSSHVVTHTIIPSFVSRRKTKNKKVLMTVDGSEHSLSAVKHSIKLLDFTDKEIHIISVKEKPELLPIEAALDQNWLDDIEKQQKIHASKAINKAKSFIEKEGLKVEHEAILTGNPAEKIIDFVTKEEIDLVVLGARSRVDLSMLLLGSVSKRVLENVNSSVLVIRS